MKILLYISGVVSVIIAIYELSWIVKSSSLAIVIILLAIIMAINSFALARREK